jgi:ATP-binding cassette subfamily B protein
MKSLKHINKYFYKYKWRLLLGTLFIILSNYYAVNGFVYARKAIDFIQHNTNSNKDFVTSELLKYAGIILGVALISGIFLFLTRQTIIVMSRIIEFDLKNEIYEHYQKLDISFYKRNNTGDLMNRISEDVGRVRMYIGPAIMYILNTAARFILTIVVMIHVNATLTMYVLIPLPVLAVTIYLISNLINKKSTQIQQQLSHITTYTQEAFSGIRVLKSYGREQFSVDNFKIQSEEYRKRNIGLVITESLFQPSMIVLIGISNIIIVYIGGKLAIEGKISYGNIIEFILYVNALTWPIASLGWVTSLIQRAAASQTRINEFLQTEPVIVNNIANAGNTTSAGEKLNINTIEFKNVSFHYPDTGIKALTNVSFKIEQGQSLAILGRTGSGKSTIAHLIFRLYDVDSGELLINGQNIKTLDLSAYRSRIGYVPQDVFLFSDTIANNIGFNLDGDADHTPQIEKAAKKAAIHFNIMEFPDKYETIVGERGITLSGGQKQRISIARAIVNNPQFLIFDDCLSAVDTQTEETILHNLKNELIYRTSIIISHRVSSVKNADDIIVLNEGCIAEQGTHKELMKKRGVYYDLYQMQLLEEEKKEFKPFELGI